MTIINVKPYSVNTYGNCEYFGDETGTPEFYMVLYTLEKHLGIENINVKWDYTRLLFTIEEIDEGCDNRADYIKVIESIYEPFKPYNFTNMKNHHLVFQIIYEE